VTSVLQHPQSYGGYVAAKVIEADRQIFSLAMAIAVRVELLALPTTFSDRSIRIACC
jgi:dipeptidyl aminopeptidase/acylaminoacyl peptidase